MINMKLTLEANTCRGRITTTSPADYERLKKFPGLLKDGPSFFIPAELRVAYNLTNRLKEKFSKLEIDPYYENYINGTFRLREIPPDFRFHTEPKPFQRIALRYAYSVRGGGLLLEPGMGKTKVVLDYIALMKFKRVVIVCPKPLLFVWEDERQVHRPDKTMYIVKSTDWEKEKIGIYSSEITVINYDKAVDLAPELSEVGYEFIGLDEALIKTHNSGRTKALTWLGKHIPFRMLMSGTLVNNSPMDVFAPVRFLEPALVGTSHFNFEEEYTVKAGKKDEQGRYVDRPFVVGYRRVPEVRSILESVSIVMTKAEWLQLPPKHFHDIYVQPSEEQRRAHIELQSNYIVTVKGKTVEVENPLTVLCKLIQISNGFIYSTQNETEYEEIGKPKKRETVFFDEQPKLDKLIELLNGELTGKRAIVWFNMDAEYELIKRRFDEEGITCAVIRGSNKGSEEVGTIIKGFNSSSSQRIFLAQARAVNYGVTVLGQGDEEIDHNLYHAFTPRVATEIFYSLNFSLEVYLQQQDRIHRMGQDEACHYYRLITNLPSDIAVAERIAEKMSIRGQILQDVITSLGIR